MPSAIDPTKPADGVPAEKADLRANFAAAKAEIEALQAGGTGVSPFVNVKDFGAVGNGTNNDTAEIQAALAHAASIGPNSASGSILYFPPGDYLIQDWLDNPGNVSMMGAGARASKLRAGSSFPATKSGANGTFDAPMVIVRKPTEVSIEIRDLYFDGANNAPSGLHLVQCINISVRNIRTQNHLVDGIVVDALQNSSFMNCRPGSCGRYNWHFMNGAKLIELLGCNGRDAGTASAAFKVQSNYPGFGLAGGDDQVRCVNWYGHILEGGPSSKQFVVDFDQCRRITLYGMNLVAPAAQAIVRTSANCNGRIMLSSCFFNGGGTVLVPAVRVEAGGNGKVWVSDCWLENYNVAGSVFECAVPDGLFVDRPHIALSVAYSNKLIANTSGNAADTRVCAYQPWRSSGTTGERPDMSDVDAVTQYWDRTLGKPIWWNPDTGTWKDATGANV